VNPLVLITTAEAAARLHVTVRRVRQMVTEGKLTNYGPPDGPIALDYLAIAQHARDKQQR
jgi:excisionase family DNA binding protein